MPELPPTAGLPLRADDFFRAPGKSFAAGLRQWLALPDPILTCSGTAAFVVALKTLHQRNPHRNNVVLPAYTCPLVALAVQLAGLHAVVCDTVSDGFDFDPEQLAVCCDQKTLAVVPTHLGGRVATLSGLRTIADANGVCVIEDAAQALGAFCHGESVGLGGDIGFFSLAVGKGLTTYEGGVLFSRDPVLHAELREMTARILHPGWLWNMRRILELFGYALVYHPVLLRFAYGNPLRKELARHDEVSAVGDFFSLENIPLHTPDRLRLRVAANALHRLPAFLDAGRARAARRIAILHDMGLSVIQDNADGNGVWPFLMVLMPTQKQRDTALAKLWREGLGVSKLFVHALPDYAYLAEYFDGQPCPHARDLASRMLTVTNSHWLDETVFDRIAQTLRRC